MRSRPCLPYAARWSGFAAVPAALLLTGIDRCPVSDQDGDDWTVLKGDCDDNNPEVNPGQAEVYNDGIDNDCDKQEAISLYNAPVTCGGGLVAPAYGEDGHYLAVRLTPPSFPFIAERIRYVLVNNSGWSAAFDHDVVLFAEPGPEPSSEPEELLRETVAGFESDEALVPVEIELSHPIVLTEPNDLYVAIQMQMTDRGASIAVRACNSDEYQYPDRDYWSNAAAPPYDWVELDAWGLGTTSLELDGQAVLNGFPAADGDGDGWMVEEGDCDDTDPAVNPNAPEVCYDGIDNNCDGETCEEPGKEILNQADATIVGGTGYDGTGTSVSSSGDVNGDGYADLVVGVYDDSSVGDYTGAVYLFHGPVSGTIDLSQADAKLVGEAPHDEAGGAVSSAGDVNADGVDDLVIGVPSESSGGDSAGAVYVVYGPVSGTVHLSDADAKLVGEAAYDRAGGAVSSAGDVNGDGYDDLVIGAPSESSAQDYAGAVYVVYGPVSGTIDLGQADAKFLGEAEGDGAGAPVSSAGDVDGDGKDDLFIGAPFESSGEYAGAAYLVYGPVSGTIDLGQADAKLVGEAPYDGAGTALSSAGDVNGDGKADLLIGAPFESSGANRGGAVYLVHGPVSGTVSLSEANAKLVAENEEDRAGGSLSSGDVNGDGYDDLFIGAPEEHTSGRYAGAAYLVYGPVSGTLDLSQADVKLMGEELEDRAGASMCSEGDIDGDGYDDLFIGAPGDYWDLEPGATYVKYSASL